MIRYCVNQVAADGLQVWAVIGQKFHSITDPNCVTFVEMVCDGKAQAVHLATLYNRQRTKLPALAKWAGVSYSSVIATAKAGDLQAEQVEGTWLATYKAVLDWLRSGNKPSRIKAAGLMSPPEGE